MGVFDFLKKQFIDVLEWTESSDDILVWRFPTADNEIQQGAQLTVRESQAALFVHQGKVADLFGAGQFTLRTQNLPLLTNLANWDKLFESPFKSDVYFFSTRLRLNQHWGTANPISFRDEEFGAVRVRAFGTFSYRISDPALFYERVSGTRDAYTMADLEGQLRNTLVAHLTEYFAGSGISFLDLAANQAALARGVADEAQQAIGALGVALEDFQVQNVSLPEELRARLDERIGMGIVGELDTYARFQTARSIPVAAAASGGAAGAGVGLGAGVAMGQLVLQSMGVLKPAGPPAPEPSSRGVDCPKCKSVLARASRFCPECGSPLA